MSAELKAFLKCRLIKVQIDSDQSATLFHCLLLYPVSPLDHHLYSSVCSEAILGTFHDRIVFRKLSESARDYDHNQLVYGVQESMGL